MREPEQENSAPEIEITPEMIEAGYTVLLGSGIADELLEGDRLTVAEIYLAMAAARPRPISPSGTL